MPEPQTHYQLSFTARQALALFVGLLLLLGVAYFLGLMTGLAGRDADKTIGAATPIPTAAPTEPARVAAAVPTPIRPIGTAAPTVPPFPRPVLGKEPTSAPGLQFFEDRAESEATPSSSAKTRPPKAKVATPPPADAGGFWVQVLSVSSEREARARRDKLIHRGYRARLFPAEGPRGSLFRVRVGPYASREEAARASEQLSREEKVASWIVPAGK